MAFYPNEPHDELGDFFIILSPVKDFMGRRCNSLLKFADGEARTGSIEQARYCDEHLGYDVYPCEAWAGKSWDELADVKPAKVTKAA